MMRVLQAQIHSDIKNILIPQVMPTHLIDDETLYHINPTGKFVIELLTEILD